MAVTQVDKLYGKAAMDSGDGFNKAQVLYAKHASIMSGLCATLHGHVVPYSPTKVFLVPISTPSKPKGT